jgi:protease IV
MTVSRTALSILLGLTFLSCKGESASERDTPAPASASSAPGLDLPWAKAISDTLEKPGPYEEPLTSADYADGAKHFRVLELSGSIAELESFSLFSGTGTKPFKKITDGLHKAAADANVAGVIVRVGDLDIGIALADELREALVAFKGEGARKVFCHAETAVNAGYHVLTACDRIGIAPLGEVVINGVAATPIHFKGLLDTLGIVPDFLHVGAFKGAAEPITRDAPSPEMITTLEAIVQRAYATMLEGLQKGRGLDEKAAIAAIDRALFMDEAALAAKLVDEVATWEAFRDASAGGIPWTRKPESSASDPFSQLGKIQRFLGMMPPERPSEPHVAVVYAVGNVIDGGGSGALGSREEIASRTLVPALRAIARDEAVAAVVLRVDSPGGSALASEQIWQAVNELAAKKPVVVSMGSLAASGGYYISCGATKIFADANTLTGSIGVVGGKIALGPALARIGIKTYAVKRGEKALLWSAMDPWTPSERTAIEDLMKTTYDRFVGHVVEGRKLDRAAVEAIAQGRVWTGADAKANGLVDEIGGLAAAIAEARKLGKVADTGGLETYPGDPTLRDVLTSIGAVDSGLPPGVRDTLTELAAVADPATVRAVQGTVKMLLDPPDTAVWAMTWVQPPR